MSEPKIWLMLVGIDFYPDRANRLRGAVNDVLDMESSLNDHYRDANIIKLVASVTGEQSQTAPPEDESLWPTRDNLIDKLEYITQKASPNDVVWVHYSGHGTLRPTKSSEFSYQEDYESDAALVLLEPNSQRGIRYLRGIELAIRLDCMASKGLKLTVVLDSCHSGSISRNEDPLVRSVPWNAEVGSEFPLQVPTLPTFSTSKNIFRDADVRSHWLLQPQGYAVLVACGPHELAREIRVGQERHNGALSYHVLEALEFCLRNQIQDVTHEIIYERIRAKMHLKLADQHPVLIGARRTPFSGVQTEKREASSTCEVIKVSADQEIWLNTGLINGVRTNDEYSIYPYAEAIEVDIRVIITDVQATHAAARRITSIASKEENIPVKVGHHAVLAALARPRAHIKLLCKADAVWDEILEKSMWLQHLSMNEQASIEIPCFSIVETDSQQYTILDSKNSAISNLPPILTSTPSASKQLLTVLEHLSKYTFVQTLDNCRTNSIQTSDFQIVARAQADPLDGLESDNTMTVSDGSKVEITFQNLSREVLYFAVLNLTPLRLVKRLYPKKMEYETVVPRDVQDILSKELPRDVVLLNEKRLAPRMTVPARLRTQQGGAIIVEDVLKFIVSTRPVIGTKAMELPDLWEVMNHVATETCLADDSFGTIMQRSLVEGHEETGHLRGETAMVKWACRSITIRTVLKIG